MPIYAVSSCCGSTLDSLCDPHVYVEHGLTTEFYCTEKTCRDMAETFGEAIDAIFAIFELAPDNADQYADESTRPGLTGDDAVYCPHEFAAE